MLEVDDEMVQYARDGATRVPDHGPAPNLHAACMLCNVGINTNTYTYSHPGG